MTVTVETGAKVANSNSYVSVSDLTSYANDRGVTLTVDTEELIHKSMDYIESLSFTGYKSDSTQSLQWPRGDVYVDGYYVEIDSIPQLLKDGQMATCIELNDGVDQLSTLDRETVSESVGSISVTYKAGSNAAKISRTINAKLRKLLAYGDSMVLMR